MNRPSRFPPPFRLGAWTVLPALNRVRGPDGEVRLEPRVMAVLVRLAASPGDVVGRLELLEEVWGDAVVGEEILTRAVSELRRVFGDRARDPRYIETIINNGYRLIAPVDVLPEQPEAAPPQPPPVVRTPQGAAGPSAGAGSVRAARTSWAVGAVLGLAVAVIAVVLGVRRAGGPPPAGAPEAPALAGRAVPLTAYPGHERQPAITPDGLRVAFAWAGPAGDAEGIWIKQRNSETPLRVSEGPGVAAWPTWSPDGQTVAWVQLLGGRSEIRAVPSLGGAARTLATLPGAVAGLDWSPDGGRLVLASRDTTTGLHRLRRLDPETGVVADLSPGERLTAGEIQPRFAPHGEGLAWIRLQPDGTSSLWVGDRDGLQRREILAGRTGLVGVAWTADGRSLVVGVDHAGTYGLWRVDAEGGGLRRLTETSEFAWNPAVAAATGDLVYEQVRVDQDLWRIRILGRDPWQLETQPFLASTRWDYEAAYSPDGSRLAVVSARSGAPELWLCDRDGGNLRRLTETGEAMIARLRWSADGTRIAFTIRDWDRSRVAVVPAAGGPLRELTPEGESERFVSWWFADVNQATGRALLLVERADDGGVEQRLRDADTGELDAAKPMCGDFVAIDRAGHYLRRGRGIAQVPAGAVCSGDEQALVSGLAPADRDNWQATAAGLFWVMRAGGQAFLMLFEPAGGASGVVTDLPGFAGTGLTVAPDGSAVVYPRLGQAAGDLMLFPRP